MASRRILSIWFPRLAAERVLRADPRLDPGHPFAVAAEVRGALTLSSLSAAAEAAGLRRGMALGDARALRPDLVTRPQDLPGERGFLLALVRWAGRFSPRLAAEPPEALALDVSGCAHLFGGEAGLAAAVEAGAADLGLSLRLGLADTLGAAWALARFSGGEATARNAGDAIDQEARATRSRAQKRGREDDGPRSAGAARIAPPGTTLVHLAPLPVAALRLEPEALATAQALGLARVGDLVGLPRAQLARRLGQGALDRLDQALGRMPEALASAQAEPVFALRLTLPDPIGREEDVLAGLDRLLGPLCERLRAAGRGARRVRLTLVRVDGGPQVVEARLARPVDAPERIRPLLALRLDGVEAGFGFEALRLEAVETEPATARQGRGTLAGAAGGREAVDGAALADLIGRLAARLGAEAVTRLHPADSHIPEKGATAMAALYAPPAGPWPRPPCPRPATLFAPEPIRPEDDASPPGRFVWRRRPRRRAAAVGPERIAPEWWLDDPAWRSGPRDYWRVETTEGERLWLFEARGEGGGWFVQGVFL